ncbi:MAG: PIN domain nuclease [Thermoprotei archaeon]|nr:MAG: PIN domain nuclease [Thermoprotei archaeon]
MIVIDASALAKYVLHEDGWEEVSRYIREMRPLYSVDHVLKEVANAIWKHAFIRKLITAKVALQLYNLLERLTVSQAIILEDELKYVKRAIEIALKHGITVYDALYIAQAEKLGELLTSDEIQESISRELRIRVYMV